MDGKANRDRPRAPERAPTYTVLAWPISRENAMIRKLRSGEYRLYSRKVDPRTGKRRNLGTFATREAAQKHERDVQYFKRR
jgi:hypothetical protein